MDDNRERQAEILDIVRSRVSAIIDASDDNTPLLQIGMECFCEGFRSGLTDAARSAFHTNRPGVTAEINEAIKAYLRI